MESETECIEAIEVSFSASDRKQKFTRTLMKESECREMKLGLSAFTSSVQTGSSSDSEASKISTTVVSAADCETPAYKKQKVRVGMTAEEDIRPRALLEMMGDEVGEPVSV